MARNRRDNKHKTKQARAPFSQRSNNPMISVVPVFPAVCPVRSTRQTEGVVCITLQPSKQMERTRRTFQPILIHCVGVSPEWALKENKPSHWHNPQMLWMKMTYFDAKSVKTLKSSLFLVNFKEFCNKFKVLVLTVEWGHFLAIVIQYGTLQSSHKS